LIENSAGEKQMPSSQAAEDLLAAGKPPAEGRDDNFDGTYANEISEGFFSAALRLVVHHNELRRSGIKR